MRHLISTGFSLLALLGLGSVAAAEQVDNPVYVAWAQYKPGTYVTHAGEAVVEMSDPSGRVSAPAAMKFTVTQTLIEITPAGAVIEATIRVTGADGKTQLTNERHTSPAKIEKDNLSLGGFLPQGDRGRDLRLVKSGTENLTYKEEKFEARTLERAAPATATKPAASETKLTWEKTWQVAKVPGGLARLALKGVS